MKNKLFKALLRLLLLSMMGVAATVLGGHLTPVDAAAEEERTPKIYTADGTDYLYLPQPSASADAGIVLERTLQSRMSLEGALPGQWDNRNIGRTADIRNQGDLSTCWAFASLSGIQTFLLPTEKEEFSVDHMITFSGYGERAKQGGTFAMALAYLTGWRGPVYEQEDPYNDGESNAEASVRYHLQEAQLLNEDPDSVKLAVLRFGSVQSSMYADEGLLVTDQSTAFYNSETDAYYYNGTKDTNHDVLIVGWDDHYPAANFASQPEADGAFLCQNSWGSEFGDGGYFYVSYYDTRIIQFAMAYTRIDPVGVYDDIYQYDDLGWVAQMGFEEYSSWGANVFSFTKDADVAAVGFYAVQPDTTYEIYYDPTPNSSSFETRKLLCSGELKNAGYYTIDLPAAIAVERDTKAAFLIKLTTPVKANQLAAETKSGDAEAIVQNGESFISADGSRWYDAAKTLSCNLCLKLFMINSRG